MPSKLWRGNVPGSASTLRPIFTRPCRLDLPTVVKTILNFGSSTVRGELSGTFDALNPDCDLPTKNAFIMRRQLIRSEAFQFLFDAFMAHFSDFKTEYGFRILASDPPPQARGQNGAHHIAVIGDALEAVAVPGAITGAGAVHLNQRVGRLVGILGLTVPGQAARGAVTRGGGF